MRGNHWLQICKVSFRINNSLTRHWVRYLSQLYVHQCISSLSNLLHINVTWFSTSNADDPTIFPSQLSVKSRTPFMVYWYQWYVTTATKIQHTTYLNNTTIFNFTKLTLTNCGIILVTSKNQLLISHTNCNYTVFLMLLINYLYRKISYTRYIFNGELLHIQFFNSHNNKTLSQYLVITIIKHKCYSHGIKSSSQQKLLGHF